MVYEVRTSTLFILPLKRAAFTSLFLCLANNTIPTPVQAPPIPWLAVTRGGRNSNVSICVPKSPEIWNNKGRVFSAPSHEWASQMWGGQQLCVKVRTRGGECGVPHQRRCSTFPFLVSPLGCWAKTKEGCGIKEQHSIHARKWAPLLRHLKTEH